MSAISADDIRRILSYCPESGEFTRLVQSSNQRPGSRAGSINKLGYVQIGVMGENHLAHRLAILITTGEWPSGQVDHINRNRSDNRLENLRVLSAAENKQNCGPRARNKSGVKGVHFCGRTKRWVAQIQANRERRFLGRFESIEEASVAYKAAAEKLHPFRPDGTFVKE